jgi:hypothetical protein
VPTSRAVRLVVVFLAVTSSLGASAAAAQDPTPDREPIGRFAADVRGTMPRFDQDPNIAAAAGLVPANLATRGLGIVAGAHVYPLRLGKVTLGLGGEVLASRASNTLEAATEGDPEGPTARTRFSALSPQISLNFGSRAGWSYISGGLGWSRFTVERDDLTAASAESSRRKTINYGGGARWFAKEHLAVSVDLRFYAVSPQVATTAVPAMPRMTLMLISAGVAFK